MFCLLLLLYIRVAQRLRQIGLSIVNRSAIAQPTKMDDQDRSFAVSFAVPTLVGHSNSSLLGDGGSNDNFWFPSISIATGIKGHVAQHITLSGDGGTCPSQQPPLSQYCEQIMLTTDGGRSYSTVSVK